MTTLGELARLIRSKNAGPFELTFDIMFDDEETFERVKKSGALSPRGDRERSTAFRWRTCSSSSCDGAGVQGLDPAAASSRATCSTATATAASSTRR